MTDLLLKYFPELNSDQLQKFNRLPELYQFWNSQINVISRKDIDELLIRHILHSLAIAKKFDLNYHHSILDLGTGGGFPGIPLAIFFPKIQFDLIDATAKKIKVVSRIVQELDLENVNPLQKRAEEVKKTYPVVVTRAVAPCKKLWSWIGKNIPKNENQEVKNGIIALKGGDLQVELVDLKRPYHQFHISEFYEEDFFESKQIIHILR